MELSWRRVEPSDIELLMGWFTGRGWPNDPARFLSNTGYLCLLDGKPAACAWLYCSNSVCGWLEFLATSPDLGRKFIPVLDFFMGVLRSQAKVLGIQLIFHVTKYPKTFTKRWGFGGQDRAYLVCIE